MMNDDLAKLVTLAVSTKTFTENPWEQRKVIAEIERRSGLSRRAFLGGMLGAVAATAVTAAIDPEKLLWQPDAKTFFMPPAKDRLFGITAEELLALEELIGSFRVERTDTWSGLRRSEFVSHVGLFESSRHFKKPISALSDEEFSMALDIVRGEAENQAHHQLIVMPDSVDPWAGHPWRLRGRV